MVTKPFSRSRSWATTLAGARSTNRSFESIFSARAISLSSRARSAATSPAGLYVDGDGAFEFQRTVSRLMEMQSPEYIALEHIA